MKSTYYEVSTPANAWVSQLLAEEPNPGRDPAGLERFIAAVQTKAFQDGYRAAKKEAEKKEKR